MWGAFLCYKKKKTSLFCLVEKMKGKMLLKSVCCSVNESVRMRCTLYLQQLLDTQDTRCLFWHSPALCSEKQSSETCSVCLSYSIELMFLCYSLLEIKAVGHFLKMHFLKQNPKIHRNVVCSSWAEIPVSRRLTNTQ